MKDKIN